MIVPSAYQMAYISAPLSGRISPWTKSLFTLLLMDVNPGHVDTSSGFVDRTAEKRKFPFDCLLLEAIQTYPPESRLMKGVRSDAWLEIVTWVSVHHVIVVPLIVPRRTRTAEPAPVSPTMY